ncbi:hypothetical protein [Verrucomicrobium spinosum]|uniref:hypothetical protein n=1 Tax=Verrucomicrobium spinosum TaxID=2736 RepID=UPI001C45A3E6|nr:hypothetical protein [Verrucomicrobium spinosum]
MRDQLAVYQKLPSMLRAAQFNVNVLAEREKLEKMEADFVATRRHSRRARLPRSRLRNGSS